MMKRFPVRSLYVTACLIAGLCHSSIFGGGGLVAAEEPLKVWPKGAPGETGEIGEEVDTTTEKSNLVDGRRLIRLGNVSEPTMQLFRADAEKDTGATMVVCPGGGYHILALDLEGSEVCEWLNSIGVNAVLLKYRVPARTGLPRYLAPLQDVQRTMSVVRHRAKEWGLDPERIGVMGFSAGGHLSATASTNFSKRSYEAIDEADEVSCRPDFTMLIYPAYLVKDHGPELPEELTVTAETPPTFLFQTQDDSVKVESSLFYYLALKQAKVPAELHVLPAGGHGYGLRGDAPAPSLWPELAEKWMRNLGVLKK